MFVTALLYRDIVGYPWFSPLENEQPDESDNGVPRADAFEMLLGNNTDKSDTDNVVIGITESNFRTVIEQINPIDRYVWDFEVTTLDALGQLTEQYNLVCDSGTYSATVRKDGELVRTIEDDGEDVTVSEYIPYFQSNRYSSHLTDVFSRCRLATPESFLSLPEDVTDFNYNISKGIYGNMVELEFSYVLTADADGESQDIPPQDLPADDDKQAEDDASEEKTGLLMREKYRISLDYGLVVNAETYENDVLVYKLETVTLSQETDKAEDSGN